MNIYAALERLQKIEGDLPGAIAQVHEILGNIPEIECRHIASAINSGTLSKRILQNILRGIEGRQRHEATGTERREAVSGLNLKGLKEIADEIDTFRGQFAAQLTQLFAAIEGKRLPNLEIKRILASDAQEVVVKLGYLFKCPTCSRPARLRAVRSLSCEDGVFQFVHSKGKRTTHQGGPEVPRLVVIPDISGDPLVIPESSGD